MYLSVLGHADVLWRESASSWQDPEVKMLCSPTPTLTQQEPTAAKEGLCPQQTLMWGWGDTGGTSHTAPEPQTRSMGAGGRLQALNPALSWLLTWPSVVC